MKPTELRLLLDLGAAFYSQDASVSVGGGESPSQHRKRLRQDPTLAHVLSAITGAPFGALIRLSEQPR